MARRKPTIKDVAAAAQVSIATASDALNGKGRVSAETRKKVHEVAAELEYTPSRAAKSLNSGRSGTLVLAVSPMSLSLDERERLQVDLDIEYYFRIFTAASAAAYEAGYLLAMLPVSANKAGLLNSAEGLILIDPTEEDSLLGEAIDRGLPCVTVGRNSRNVSWVDNDFMTGTLDTLEQISSANPAFFLSGTASSYVRDELTAYLNWCGENDVRPNIIQSRGSSVNTAQAVIHDALVQERRVFDAVITTLDTLAIATERSAKELGLRVPEDLEIVSLLDSRYFELGSTVTITALDLHPAELGRSAVEILLDYLESGGGFQKKLISASLRKRGSTRG